MTIGAIALGAVALLAGVIGQDGGPSWISLTWLITGPGPFLASGAWIVWARPGNRAGDLLTWAALVLFALPFGLEGLVDGLVARSGVSDWMWIPIAISLLGNLAGVILLTQLLATLPDGNWDRPERPVLLRWMWGTLLIAPLLLTTNDAAYHRPIEFDGLEVASPFFIESWSGIGGFSIALFELHGALLLVGAWLLIRRFRSSDERDRRRIRWILYGFGTMVFVGVGTYYLGAIGAMPPLSHGPLLAILSIPMAAGPLSIAVAVIEPSWIRRDSIARKSLVFTIFSVAVMLVWVTVASAFGIAADERLGGDVAIVVAVLGAIAFQPARSKLVTWADRSIFGERTSPYEALADLSPTMEEEPTDLLSRLARTIKSALRVQWVRVNTEDESVTVGEIIGPPEVIVPLQHREVRLGSVECGRKLDGPFGDTDRRLVNTLVSQVAVAIHSARLAGRIVTAQEQERRRIERNIHDGAQQDLVALIARLGMVRTDAEHSTLDPSSLADLQDEVRRILEDLRELAQGIHPSVLSDGGLVEAVEERVAGLPTAIKLDIDPGLRGVRFDPDVEGAAWFVVTEALTNVLKHAGPARVRVSLERDRAGLSIKVEDDGRGFDPALVTDQGLVGLRDRCSALGGELEVESNPGGGTIVRAVLPVGLP